MRTSRTSSPGGRISLNGLGRCWPASHHRAKHLWEKLGLQDHFDRMHYAADLGCRKSDPEFYRTIEQRIGIVGKRICLIDDDQANVDAARRAGWNAAH
ncbi:HAD family hydrolase [Arthrobacter tecti]